MSFEEAVHQTASKDQFSTYDRTGRLQEVQAFHFILADKLTIAVTNAGCFTDAVELCLPASLYLMCSTAAAQFMFITSTALLSKFCSLHGHSLTVLCWQTSPAC